MTESEFRGFPKEMVTFWIDLKENNNKLWFDRHRNDYDQYVLEPSRAFVVAMGNRLREISPGVHADPRANKSLFRIHRDTRFSHDKSPYKSYMGILFWEGVGKRMECSCYYFHLDPPKLMLGIGVYLFAKHQLAQYRDSVIHPTYGTSLKAAIDDVSRRGPYAIGGKHYKKVPRGYDAKHKNADLLLYNGLYTMHETDIPDEFYMPAIIEYCFEKWSHMDPLHKWLVPMTERALL
jgi:uncharacterized protein (TIGR02453 family)